MGYYEDELALRETQINRKRKRNRKRLLIGAGVAAGGALALNNEGIRNKVTNHLRSDSQMMNNIGNGVRKVGKGIYNNFKPSATTMSIRRGTERAADAISNYTPKYNKRRRKLANIIDDLYHSGYSDGYYDGMELYHSDDETREERAKRRARRKFGRTVALGVGTTAGVAALGAGIAAADKRHSDKVHQRRQDELNSYYQRLKNTADNLKSKMGPFRKKRNIHGFRRNKRYNFLKGPGSYKVPLNDGDFGSYMKLNRIRRERLNY